MKGKIRIDIADPEDSAGDFIGAWKRAMGEDTTEVEHHLHFEDLETLLKTLTPARWMLLKKLREEGPMSIRALAGELKRDYKNVHTDVKILERVDLIESTRDKKICVPWDIVEASLRLAA